MVERLLNEIGKDNSLLIVDDDEPFLRRLSRAMEKRGFSPETADSIAAGTSDGRTQYSTSSSYN